MSLTGRRAGRGPAGGGEDVEKRRAGGSTRGEGWGVPIDIGDGEVWGKKGCHGSQN